MAKAVQIPWYATGFRGDSLESALTEIAAVALRYGATSWSVYRSHDDRYRLLQYAEFESKADWNRYWNGPEFTRFRTITSGWYQVPVIYGWWDVSGSGDLAANAASNGHGNGAVVEGAV